MPRRNLRWLLAVAVLSLVCYAYAPRSRYSRVLADNLDLVSREFYRPVSDLDLFEGAMSGMVKRLDKYSFYFRPDSDAQHEFQNDLSQEFVGIGIECVLDPATKQLMVLAPTPDGPALAAGVRAGDHIVKIEGQSTQGMSVDEGSKRIRGAAGSPIAITVQHRGEAVAVELTIVRRIFQRETVVGATRDSQGRWKFLLPGHAGIGYVWIKSFAESADGRKKTSDDFLAALQELRKSGIRGLVLDLRNDPGGTFEDAVDVCDMLVAQGDIVTTRSRDGKIREAVRASGRAEFTDFPMAVLVNGDSASASEIVAACLQDNQRAVVIGQRSYGKGTVQEVFDLGPRYGTLKFTIATYWRPSGQDINRPLDDGKDLPWGVTPNEGFDVPVGNEERQRLIDWRQEREIAALTGAKPPPEVPDRVLLKAVEYLDAKMR